MRPPPAQPAASRPSRRTKNQRRAWISLRRMRRSNVHSLADPRGGFMHRSRLLFIVMGLLFMTHEGLAGLEVFVYPSKGQTKEQQEQDEFACYKWAKEQTGFDPTQPVQQQAGTPPPQNAAVKGAARGAAIGA